MGIIWEKERLQEEWKLNIMCPIHKKGDKSNCQNYRGMSLLCTAYRTFTILRNKLAPYTEKVTGEYQAEFGQGQSTIDQISSETNAKQMLDVCLAFTDKPIIVLEEKKKNMRHCNISKFPIN